MTRKHPDPKADDPRIRKNDDGDDKKKNDADDDLPDPPPPRYIPESFPPPDKW